MKRYYFGPEETAASSEATNVFHQRLDFEICVETKMYLCGNENVFVWKWECIWLVNEKIFARPLLAVCGLRLSALAVRGHSSQQQVGKRRRGGGEKRRKKRKKEKEEKENRETTSTALKKSNWPTNFTFHIFESCQSDGQSVEEKVAGFAGALARFCQNENSQAKQEIWFCHDREIKKGQVECKKKPRKQLIRNRRGGGRGWWNETSEKLNETRKEREGLRRVEVEEGEATTSQRSHLATAPHSQSPTLVHTWPRKDCVHRKQTRCQQNRYQRWTIGFSEWNEPIYKNNQPIK